MSIEDYINAFERLYLKAKAHKMELPDGVLAYRLLKNANLSANHEQLAKATLSSLSYDSMKVQLKIFFIDVSSASGSAIKEEIKFEENETLYARPEYSRSQPRPHYRNRNRNRGARGRGHRGNKKQKNRTDTYGNTTTCRICNSWFHYAFNCPDAQAENVLIAEENHDAGNDNQEVIYLTNSYSLTLM